jgi:hypothetical protein
MQTHSGSMSAPKLAVTLLVAIILNDLLFLYLIPGDVQSALTFGAISGLAGAILYLLLNSPQPVLGSSAPQPRGGGIAPSWSPHFASPAAQRK